MSDDPNNIDGFQLINCVASGSHSQIWEVSEQGGTQRYAMKLLLPDAHADREIVATLKHEAKVQKSLAHPNFIQLHQIVANKQHAYILMDFFRAANLKLQLSSDFVGLQSRLRKLIEGLCIALGYLHDKGWVHRDIKPENILFNKSTELRLIDFSLSVRHASGVSKLFGGKPKVIQGTRTYIAPETLLRRAPTPQTDIYSLGITLFELLTGERPFTASTPDQLLNKHLKERPPAPSDFNPNVTPEMDAFALRMLAKKPDKRHANMNELLAEFRALRVFKQDVKELQASEEQRKKEIQESGGDLSKAWTLDSRTDAMRTEKGGSRPARRSQPKTSPPAATPPQPPQPYPGQGPAGAVPNYPYPGGYYQPGMMPPAPGQSAPAAFHPPQQAPPSGYPAAGGYAGYPPGAPPMPQPSMPQLPPPGTPTIPQPPVQQPPAGQPSVQQSGAQQPSVPPPAGGPPSGQPGHPQSPPPVSPQPQRPEQQIAASAQSASAQPPLASPAPTDGKEHVAPEEKELRPQAPIPAERHASQTEDDGDLPLMEELPDIL